MQAATIGTERSSVPPPRVGFLLSPIYRKVDMSTIHTVKTWLAMQEAADMIGKTADLTDAIELGSGKRLPYRVGLTLYPR